MKKITIMYLFACLFLTIFSAISVNVYQYRQQSLENVLAMDQVVKVHNLDLGKESNTNTLIIDDNETIKQLADFYKQYQVKPSKKEGWVSKKENAQLNFVFEYKDGSTRPYTFDGDIIASYSLYKVVNYPIDYKSLEELFLDSSE